MLMTIFLELRHFKSILVAELLGHRLGDAIVIILAQTRRIRLLVLLGISH
jgi:GGDEF domain-containing protein